MVILLTFLFFLVRNLLLYFLHSVFLSCFYFMSFFLKEIVFIKNLKLTRLYCQFFIFSFEIYNFLLHSLRFSFVVFPSLLINANNFTHFIYLFIKILRKIILICMLPQVRAHHKIKRCIL